MEDSTTKEPTDLILEIQRELATILTSITLPKEAVDANLKREKEKEEKARLIAQVLELQNTLDDLSSRVDNVKEENLRLRSENQVLGQYIENLMAASNVFQPANDQPKAGKRK